MAGGTFAMSGADLNGKYADVVPRPASTILLVRDGDAGLEVFMVKRHHKIDFASGAMVFPGGKVDPEDSDAAARAATVGADALDDTQLGFRVSAIREAFEEVGVLIATRRDGDELDPDRVARLKEGYAAELEKNNVTMGEMAAAEELLFRVDRLAPYAHWITPPILAKRFDTPFFLAEAPEAQIEAALHDGREAVDSVWATPQEILDRQTRGEVTMVFATELNLMKLARSANVAEALDAARAQPVVTVLPKVHVQDGRKVMEIPEAAGYGKSLWDVGAA